MDTLKERAEQIRDETRICLNTSNRVGGVLVELAKSDEDKALRIEVLEEEVSLLTDMLLTVSPRLLFFAAEGGAKVVNVYTIIEWKVI